LSIDEWLGARIDATIFKSTINNRQSTTSHQSTIHKSTMLYLLPARSAALAPLRILRIA
jgi:hypothetical protein